MTSEFTKPFEHNVLGHALRAAPMWPAEFVGTSLDEGEKTAEYVAAAVFADAHRRYRITEAKLTLSLDEGEPGDARDTAIENYRDATEALRSAYMVARALQVVREGITPNFISRDDAETIAAALSQMRENTISDRPGDLAELFATIANTGAPGDIFVR